MDYQRYQSGQKREESTPFAATSKSQLEVFNPVPDFQSGAVRRGSGDIWSRVRQELLNIKQGVMAPLRAADDRLRAGGEVLQSKMDSLVEGVRGGAREFKRGYDALHGKDTGPLLSPDHEPVPLKKHLRDFYQGSVELRRAKHGETAAAPTSAAAERTRPVVPTAEAGAPANTYDRGEAAPSGNIRLQRTALYGTAPPARRGPTGTAPPARRGPTGTAPPARRGPTGNRYIDMYYADPAMQQKHLQGLPEPQAPVEVIRGAKRTHWSPKTQKEYATALEAAYGVDHKDEMSKSAQAQKRKTDVLKERIKAHKAYEVHTKTDPDTLEEELVVFDPNSGRFVNDAESKDRSIVQALLAGGIGQDQFKAYFAGANSAQKKRLLALINEMKKAESSK